jgi:NAD(P)-dependent dehydrogenase (short-subunit alcohol dehydrogenase family)
MKEPTPFVVSLNTNSFRLSGNPNGNSEMKSPIARYRLALLVLLAAFFSAQAEDHQSDRQKAVLVTGASSGIGLSITEHLTARGHFVYAGARKDADLERLNAMDNVQSIRLDVNKHEQIAAAVKTVEQAGRGLHAIVNNAGVGVIWPLIEAPEEELDFQFQVNIYGPYRITKAFAPILIKNKGRITTISSISGILSGQLFGPYSMSKHAIEAFSDSLAREMERFEVKVSVVEPGNYRSKIGANIYKRIQNNDVSYEQSLYKTELQGFLTYLKDAEAAESRADPIAVAKAVEHALFDDHPKMRYMVVPVQREAEITIRKAMEEMVQLNQDHEFSYDRDTLVKMLDETLEAVNAKTSGE